MSSITKRFHSVFLEIACRVIQRVHCEHQAFSFSDEWRSEEGDAPLTKILCGEGIEVALERAVTSGIAAEFNRFRASMGWVLDNQGKRRNYLLQPEVLYSRFLSREGKKLFPKDSRFADLVANTLDQRSLKIDESIATVVIEAKRAKRYSVEPRGKIRPQSGDCSYDIAKDLVRLHDLVTASDWPGCRGWVLIWGVSKSEKAIKDIDRLISRINGDIEDAGNELSKEWGRPIINIRKARVEPSNLMVRWIPEEWRSKRYLLVPEVMKWIWVVLAETVSSREKEEQWRSELSAQEFGYEI